MRARICLSGSEGSGRYRVIQVVIAPDESFCVHVQEAIAFQVLDIRAVGDADHHRAAVVGKTVAVQRDVMAAPSSATPSR